jgi:protein SSD1
MEQQQSQQPQQGQQQAGNQPGAPQAPAGGVHGPTGRRLHIAHRRSPSELTPLMSMFANPGSEFLFYPCYWQFGFSW